MNILFIGTGNMAEAIIKGLISSRIFRKENIFATDIDSDRLRHIKKKYAVNTISSAKVDLEYKDIIILAVKPNKAEEVLEWIASKNIKDKIIISIMAGKKLKFLNSYLQGNKVARVMPNTPALLGKGMSVVSFLDNLEESDKLIVENILKSIGEAVELDEKYMDAVTALSGSGPAYIFYLAELMIKAGKTMGLDESISKKLTLQTINGATSMLCKLAESPDELRKKVTSPKGTTEAALKYMKKNKYDKIFIDALKEAKKRSKEL